MPRYFFHVMDGRTVIDTEGAELDSFADVRLQAVCMAGEILSQEATGLSSGKPWQMTVADAAGDTVFTLRFEADHHGY